MYIIATIKRVACRHLVEVFTRLVIIGATEHCIRLLARLKFTPTKDLLPLPSSPEKKTVFLDLDETLIHSTMKRAPKRYDFVVHPKIKGTVVPVYVLKRPGADELLRDVSANFEIVVFTAGTREYASLILDRLDPCGRFISHRLYRDACKKTKGMFVKDLSAVGRALHRVVLVDDNPNSYLLQPENAIPVAPFKHDLGDRELRRVTEFLQVALLFDDMRVAVAHYRSIYENRKE